MNKRLELLLDLNIYLFFKYNFISRRIERDKGKYIFPYKGSILNISNDSRIVLHDNMHVGVREVKGSKRETIVFLREGAVLTIKGRVAMKPGSTLQLQSRASVTMGRTNMNYGATIVSGNCIDIGDEVLISRNVVIYDSDFHKIIDRDGNQLNTPRKVIIGNHVWIGVGSIILRGAEIGDGVVVAALSLVGRKIKEGTMCSGNPARSYSEIMWED